MDLSNENIVHVKGKIEYLQFKKLLEYHDIIHGYALNTLDFRNHNENNFINSYDEFLNTLGLELNTLVRPNQTHTNNVLSIKEKQNKEFADINISYLDNIDGTITKENNIALATTNADCILLMLYDPIKKVIANIHSGWRGTFGKISSNAIKQMKKEYDCNPKDIIVCICPSIRVCHFEVEDDVKEDCEKIFEYTGRLKEIIKIGEIKDGKQKYFIDTILITKILLEEEGIRKENIIDSNICSVCSKAKVHSRRGEGLDFGLGSAVICMKNNW